MAKIELINNIERSIPRQPGIYSLVNKKNKRVYVGASQNLRVRIKQHIYSIARQRHPMSVDTTVDDLEVSILEVHKTTEKLHEREEYWKLVLGDSYCRADKGNWNW